MTDNKNTLLAILLSAIVLIGWQYFIGLPAEKQRLQQQQQQQAQQQAQQQQAPAQPSQMPAGSPPAQSSAPPVPGQVPPAGGAVQTREVALAAGPRIKIDTPRLAGSIALKGARID